MRTKTRAFTLIELLVVVAILALLISILVPSLNKARQQAKQLVCLANLKQIGDAMIQYTLDHNGFYTPKQWKNHTGVKGSIYSFLGKGGVRPGYRWLDKNGADARWLNYPYLTPERPAARDEFLVAKCPAGEDKGKARTENIANFRVDTNYDDFGTSYGSNHNSGWSSLMDYGDKLTCVQAEKIIRPGMLVAIAEDGAFGNAWKSYQRPFWHGFADKFNVAYADGHADFNKIPWGEPIGVDYRFVEPERMPDSFDRNDPYGEGIGSETP